MIALIAGTGSLPIQACKALSKEQKDFFVISLFPEDNFSKLQNASGNASVLQQPFYKVNTILTLLKEHETKQAIFLGKVDKQNLLKRFKLDWLAIKLLATLATKSDRNIMNKITYELGKHGIEVLPQHTLLQSLFVSPGILTGTMSPEIKASIDMGMHVAQQIAQCDIGQTVVVKDKMVLAVEAIEGTDACIKRGIELGENDIIICKTAHHNHDKKFDLPTIGTATLDGVKKGEIKAIAWQSNKTFVSDKEAFIARAQELGITLVSV